MIEIKTFEEADTDEIIRLVLHCQNDGSRPLVSVQDQPELLCIREKYFGSGGCFWVAKDGNKIAGSIGLMKSRDGIGILKKFFVYHQYRGKPHHLGQKLYTELLEFAQKSGFEEIVLDTPKNTQRAHMFYEKVGFTKVSKDDLGITYDYPYQDSDFFRLKI